MIPVKMLWPPLLSAIIPVKMMWPPLLSVLIPVKMLYQQLPAQLPGLLATMPHTETSSSQDNAATTTINHTPPPVEALSLQNSSCGEVVDKTKYRSLLRSNQRHRHTIKVLKKNTRELQNVSVK